MKVGFAVIRRPTGAEFQIYKPRPQAPGIREDPRLSLVNFARTAQWAAVVMGRLYYREDQLKKLDSPPAEIAAQIAENDAALALAVYHRAGKAGLETLEGDFSLVVWDVREQMMLAMRDPSGGYPLFWLQKDGLVAMASGLAPLVALLPQPAIDMEYVSDFLTLPAALGEELESSRSIYEGINRLAPRSSISIRCNNESTRVEQGAYWDWQQHIVAPQGKTLEDVGREYEHALRASVRERMRGRVAAHCSGGMDSTSLALLASAEAARRGDAPVIAMALVYERMEVLSRETAFVELALKNQPGMQAHRVVADDILDFAALVDPPAHDEPWTWLFRGGMNRVLLDDAIAAGAHTIMTGIGGDELLNASPVHLADLMRRGRMIAAWRDARRWARAGTSSPWNVLYPNAIRPLLPMALRGGVGPMLKSMFGRRSTRYKDQTMSSVPPWVVPEFAKRHALRQRAIGNMRRVLGRPRGLSTPLAMGLGAARTRCGDMSRWHLAAPHGLHVTHPFLDARVMSLGLGIPDHIRAIPGVQKPVLGEAMRNILPEEIRLRPRKSHFNEVYNLGLSHYLPKLEEIVMEAPIQTRGIFDQSILIKSLHEAALMGGGNIIAEERLNLSLAMIQWMKLKDQWNAATPKPAAVILIE